jgi:hypothetical protein
VTAAHSTASKGCTPRPAADFRSRSWSWSTANTEILKGFGDYLTTSGVPGLDLDHLDYQALAQGYGIPAVRTGRPDEFAVAVKEAFTAATGPQMIIVDVAPGVALGG